MKTCRVCQSSKSLSEFYADKTMAGGYRSACKECIKAARRVHYEENADQTKSMVMAYQQSEHGQEIRKIYQRKRAQTEVFKSYLRAWALTEKGRASRRNRVNRFARTPKGNAASKRRHAARRARERVIINTLTDSEWAEILASHNNRCKYCGRAFDADLPPTQDHVIPISKDGHHTKENVVPACKPCNSRKRDRLWQVS